MNFKLVDDEADGTIEIEFNKKNYGLSVTLTDDLRGTSTYAQFSKTDFIKLMKKVLKKMEEE